MARHDREDPHSLEDQLAWLDAIKEMPDEVEIAVSAVTSATLASAASPGASSTTAPPAQPAGHETPSPYPQDPWSLVPSEPASGALFRNAVDSMYGSASVAVADDAGVAAPPNGDTGSAKSAESGLGSADAASVSTSEPAVRADRAQDDQARGDGVQGDRADSVERAAETVDPFDPFATAFRTSTLGGAAAGSSAVEEAERSAPREDGDAKRTATPSGGDQEPALGSGFGGGFGKGAFNDSPADTDSFSLGAFADAETRKSGRTAPESPASSSSPAAGSSGSSGSSSASNEEPLRGWLEPAVPVDQVTPPGTADSRGSVDKAAPSEWPSMPERLPSATDHFESFPGEALRAESFTGEQARPGQFSGDHGERVSDDRFAAFGGDRFGGEAAPRFPAEVMPADPFAPDRSASVSGEHPFRAERMFPAERQDGLTGQDATFRVTSPAVEPKPPMKEDPFSGSLRDDLAVDERRPFERDGDVDDRAQYEPRRRQAPPPPAFSAPSRPASGTKPSADSLDPDSLLKGRRNAPKGGWRRLVYKASAGWIKPGEPSEVRRRRELINRARTPVATGHHRVAVLSLKGGVGKTTTTVGLGATLAQVRGDRVIAVDANPDRGTLSDKVELETSATVRDLLNERGQIKRYVDIRAFTSQAPSRLEILASDRDPSVSEAFSAKDYAAVSQVLENFYSICITDCGTGLLHSAMSGVLGLADQIVLISSPSVDGARAASATLDWLEAHNYGELVRAATVVLCSVRPRSKSTVDLDRLEAHFSARCRAVIRVPYDPHLEEGAEIDLERLQEATREAYLKLAASVGDAFAGPQSLGERRFSEIPDQL
ncbi:hypothetical protein GCM10023194_53270 [Planotetraspora phitsanulokensis]|uniref:CobQ/CobB/MinD/ParA nucleotide binding domain-containing protein n=1 Tax=Planotetraspora phitsanulokensis TaxID=575192 RepID=A0A8J3XIZ8_9ACTN|nr:MinD/ParA family protein [Planotetraspora phitsanulokensis]GII42665.1 hypothetical protein Pph01_76680 [Planotetraspora phitsanulokensis]